MSIRKERVRIVAAPDDGVTDWDSIINKPSAYPAMSHPHPMDDVNGLKEWAEQVEEMMPRKLSQLEDDVGLMKSGDSISYSILQDKPILFSGEYEDLEGKPQMAPVAFSGEYSDLANTPVIPTLPTLGKVAYSSDYNDLSNKPTIPTVNYPVVSVNGKTGAVVLSSSDTGSAPATHTHTISNITGLQAALDSKQNSTVSRRQEVYSGVTDAAGLYSVTFANPFTAAPNLQVQLIGATHNHSFRVVSVTATGFTIAVGIRAGLTVLGLTVLGFSVDATAGIAVDVIATSKT